MLDYLRNMGLAVRRWPLYVGLVLLGLLVLAQAGRHGYRLLGDDNQTFDRRPASPPRAPSPPA